MKIKHSYIYNKVKEAADHLSAVSTFCCKHAIGGILALTGLCLASCGAENSISRRYPCQFIFKTINHPGTSIETALNNQGTYAFVSTKQVKGVWHIYSILNDGKNKVDDYTLSTLTENYANYSYIGAGNDTKDATKNGFILGLTNFNGPIAWDRQCPNCITQYGSTNFPLEWTGNRQSVVCKKCNRTYALETGAITDGNKGDALMKYNVTYNGIGSVLTVGN